MFGRLDYKKTFKVDTNRNTVEALTRDMYNDILPFIKQMKYKSTGREIILYDGSDLKLALSKGLPCDAGIYRFCKDIYLIIEANSDNLPLDLDYEFNIADILSAVKINEMYNTYLSHSIFVYDFETYCNKIRFIIYTLYISLSADYVIETMLSKVKDIEEEIGKLRKDLIV